MECLADIRDGHGAVINRTRDVINALAFSPFTGGPITMDHENTVKAYSASPSIPGRGHSLIKPQAPVWCPCVGFPSPDGRWCYGWNLLDDKYFEKNKTRRFCVVPPSDMVSPEHDQSYPVCVKLPHPILRIELEETFFWSFDWADSELIANPFLVYKIFQMDYNRNTKEYRMLDRFLPHEFLDRPTATRTGKGKSKEDSSFLTSTGACTREVGVHRIVWNNGNGLASSNLLAAATASGLCRVDILWGRWLKDRAPYGSAEGIRMLWMLILEFLREALIRYGILLKGSATHEHM